jgi:hypothetical protein
MSDVTGAAQSLAGANPCRGVLARVMHQQRRIVVFNREFLPDFQKSCDHIEIIPEEFARQST